MGTDPLRGQERLLDAWLAFEQATRERHGVADTVLATAHGVALERFHKRTARERWHRPRPGLRIHPHVPDSVQQRLMVVVAGTAGLAAASRDTAAWLHELQAWPPDRPSVAVAHGCRAVGYRDVTAHRARWLRPDDVIESIFQDDVARALLDLGYPVDRSTHRIATPDGIGLTADIALALWCVALETEGDAFHRTRRQRRLDRRRIAAYAGTDWVPVPIDWRDWLEDRDHVLDAIDAAIAAQRRRGIGREHLPPRRAGQAS